MRLDARGATLATGRRYFLASAISFVSELRRAARSLRRGGVGYYPGSDFVHVYTGRLRSW